MKIKLYFRLCRVFLHLLTGLSACAFVFPWASHRLRDRVVQGWSRRLVKICGVTVEPPAGAPALAHAMVVANHVSWLDIFVINALYPCRFVAKSEIREWPLLGWLADKGGTVFLARGNRRDLRQIFKGLVLKLQQGERVAFFPEGTTGSQGGLLPFHANLFEAAVDAGVMVQPYALCYMDGTHQSLHPSIEFIGEMTFAQSMVTILSGPPIFARVVCSQPINAAGAHRRDVCAAAHASVGAMLSQEIVGR
ncbi:1-acyl-sn-glycerol-3-phosphate acyltransferase [Massilia atriviolacea]|uniref:1-acyl-sn-glycerol-3-phosphate acyltransferase n=1 Tax=Massilia atriviolacea TaxID=2495579 RepID=A0A430HG66_9BURK|nr:lysophospholipid acyltransferase family protein [Massilia atriviolacea]RSZ56496.1 1-acyl-sn-glycerol-3-phosphate acyltransferase [Massilia atriviolacea]